MNLIFPGLLDSRYKSESQKIRVISERWVQNEMYCPSCGNNHLLKLPNNAKVADFMCEFCKEIYELKSNKNRTTKTILDGAYQAAIERITSNTNPNLFVLNYAGSNVIDFTVVPKYFFTPDFLKARNPLSPTARRAGYIGSIILYEKIPLQGKISVIRSGIEICKKNVVANYQQVKKLKTTNLNLRGWLMDVLNCLNKIDNEEFSLREFYRLFAEKLAIKHPDNFNVQAKIRQKLQILRNKGFIEFLGNGNYRKKNLSF